MNKKNIAVLLFFLVLSLASCRTNESTQFPKVVDVKSLDFEEESFGQYAVSPDGQYFYTTFGGKINIETGEITPVNNYACTRSASIRISPNDRYLAGSNDATGMGVFDIQEGKCYQPQNLTPNNPVESWSPESNRFITAQNWIIMDYPSFNRVPYPSDYPIDFRKVKHIYGSSNVLWDKDSNLPIAEAAIECEGCILWDDPNFPNRQAKVYLIIRSLNVPALHETSEPIRERLLTFDWNTGTYFQIFDPTGEYILVAIEERTSPPTPTHEMTPQQKYDYYYDPKYVKDTVLILVHWRTEEHIELLRLSQYGQVQSYAIVSEMSWSADGSTIFIPRKNEPPLVLKMKYP